VSVDWAREEALVLRAKRHDLFGEGRWFHYVYASEPSFISFFLANFYRTITYAVWENWIKAGLHRMGLYGRRNGCTCHPMSVQVE